MLEAWPEEVAGPISREIHNVLVGAHGQVLTVGVVLALYFASSGIESLRIGLNRAYTVVETRSVWWLRLESIGYVILAAVGMLASVFLVLLAPLIWQTLLRRFPALEPFGEVVTFVRLATASVLLIVPLFVVHKWLPAGKRRFLEILPGILGDACLVADHRHRVRSLSRRFRVHLFGLLRRSCLADDRARVPVLDCVDLHLWRRTECHDREDCAQIGSARRAAACKQFQLARRLDRIFEIAQTRARRLTMHRHVAGLVLVLPHQLMRGRDLVPGETPRPCRDRSGGRSRTDWPELACFKCAK